MGAVHSLSHVLYKCQHYKTKETPSQLAEKNSLNDVAIGAIITDCLPFGIFRRPGMSKLLHRLKPGDKVPHRHTSKRVIKKKFIEARSQFREKLSKISKISLTSDLWKAIAQHHHIALTGHFFNKRFEIKSCILGFKQIVGQHNSQNIRNYIDHELNTLNLQNKIAGITTDNASDIKGAVKNGLGVSNGCLCHIVNLTVQNGLYLWSKLK